MVVLFFKKKLFKPFFLFFLFKLSGVKQHCGGKWPSALKPGLHETQLPVERNFSLVSSLIVERRCWLRSSVARPTVFKPPQKLGGLLSSFKDAIKPGYRQGAICKINCSDCDQCYIGETKRWFEKRKKEHMRVVKNSDNNATALCKYEVELDHSID